MARPKGTGGVARELGPEDIKRLDRCLLSTVHEHRNRALLYLGLGSGMRIAEMTKLRLRDVSPHGSVLEEVILEKHSTKSGRSRTVALSKQAIKALELYLEASGRRQGDLEAPLFPSQMGSARPLHPRSAVRLFRQMCEQAGVAGASSHSMRRSHANALRRRGVDMKIIQEQLGHASLSTTERYFRVDPLEKRRAVSDLRF